MQIALFILVALVVLVGAAVLGVRNRNLIEVTIKAGDHYPSLFNIFEVVALVGFFGSKTFSVRFFDGTDTRDEGGTWGQSNKVLGRTHGWNTPRGGSTRLAWLGLGNGFVRAWTMIEVNKLPIFKNPQEVSHGRAVLHDVKGFGIPCVPYYGGDNAAPTDVFLTIRRVPS